MSERDKAANEYADGTVFVDESGDDETLVRNIRFMAFSAGYEAGEQRGAERERERVVAIIEEVFKAAWQEGGYGRMEECDALDGLLYDIEGRLKQKLQEPKS